MFNKLLNSLAVIALLFVGAETSAGTLSGRVTHAGGAPMEGAMVTVSDPDQAKSITVFSGRHGTYRLEGLKDGTYVARARRLGYADQDVDSVVVNGAATMNFALTELSPEGWAEQAPASVWAARVELDDADINT